MQSLVDSDWVALRDELGFEVYRWTPTSSWGRATRITRFGEEAFKRALPHDLARWVGELPELPALLTGFGLPGCDGRAVTPQDGGTTRE